MRSTLGTYTISVTPSIFLLVACPLLLSMEKIVPPQQNNALLEIPKTAQQLFNQGNGLCKRAQMLEPIEFRPLNDSPRKKSDKKYLQICVSAFSAYLQATEKFIQSADDGHPDGLNKAKSSMENVDRLRDGLGGYPREIRTELYDLWQQIGERSINDDGLCTFRHWSFSE